MQSVQETTQTKKTVPPKKEKKTVTSVQTPVQQSSTTTPTEVPPTIVEETQNTEVSQEFDVSSVIDFLNTSSDKLTDFGKLFKDSSMSKDDRLKFETAFKKYSKSFNTLQQYYVEYLSRQLSVASKGHSSKNSGVKKNLDKDKSAIHKKLNVHPFLLAFMKLDKNTLVSRSEALTAITTYVSEEKAKNPDIIVENDKRSFKLVGALKPLFDGIHAVMKSKNLVEVAPTQIKYTQIMQYMTHCFIKDTVAPTTTTV